MEEKLEKIVDALDSINDTLQELLEEIRGER